MFGSLTHGRDDDIFPAALPPAPPAAAEEEDGVGEPESEILPPMLLIGGEYTSSGFSLRTDNMDEVSRAAYGGESRFGHVFAFDLEEAAMPAEAKDIPLSELPTFHVPEDFCGATATGSTSHFRVIPSTATVSPTYVAAVDQELFLTAAEGRIKLWNLQQYNSAGLRTDLPVFDPDGEDVDDADVDLSTKRGRRRAAALRRRRRKLERRRRRRRRLMFRRRHGRLRGRALLEMQEATQLNRPIRIYDGHQRHALIESLCYVPSKSFGSPDGAARLLSGSLGGTFLVHHFGTGEVVGRVDLEDTFDTIMDVKFIETKDWIATCAHHNKCVFVWDVHLTPVRRLSDVHEAHVWCTEFDTLNAPDVMLTGSEDLTAKSWDLRTFESVATFQHSDAVTTILPCLDMNLAVTGTYGGTLTFWDTRRPDAAISSSLAHMGQIHSMVRISRFQFATGARDGTIRLRSLLTRQPGPKFVVRRMTCSHVHSMAYTGNPADTEAAGLVGIRESAEKKERIGFLCGSETADLRGLKIGLSCGQVLRCPRVFYLAEEDDDEQEEEEGEIEPSSKKEEIVVMVSAEKPVDEKLFLRMLLGDADSDSEVSLDDSLALFSIFATLGLIDHAYVICRFVQGLRDGPGISAHLREYLQSNSTPDWATDAYLCSLCAAAVATGFKEESQKDKDDKDKLLAEAIARASRTTLEDLPMFHELLSRRLQLAPRFHVATADVLIGLHESMRGADLRLRCEDGSECPAHLFCLILQSNFFKNLLTFGGSETASAKATGKLEIEAVTGDALKALVRYLYTDGPFPSDPAALLILLAHAEMYRDLRMKRQLLRKLRMCIREAVEEVSSQQLFAARFEDAKEGLRTEWVEAITACIQEADLRASLVGFLENRLALLHDSQPHSVPGEGDAPKRSRVTFKMIWKKFIGLFSKKKKKPVDDDV